MLILSRTKINYCIIPHNNNYFIVNKLEDKIGNIHNDSNEFYISQKYLLTRMIPKNTGYII